MFFCSPPPPPNTHTSPHKILIELAVEEPIALHVHHLTDNYMITSHDHTPIDIHTSTNWRDESFDPTHNLDMNSIEEFVVDELDTHNL
jgi:hypothetical protein